MNQLLIKDEERIENMIYEISEKQVMFGREILRTKCYYYLYDKIITHYDIGLPISVVFKYVSTKFGKEINV